MANIDTSKLAEALVEIMEHITVSADDVDGLEEEIIRVLEENHTNIDADDVHGLESMIESEVENAFNNMDRRVDVDDVRGLEDAIDTRVDEVLDRELPNAIRECAESQLSNQLTEAVARCVDENIRGYTPSPADVKAAVLEALHSQEAQETITGMVRTAMADILRGMLNVPLATPVKVGP